MELAEWIAALLFLSGIIAFIIEVFVVPGFGLAGVSGLILMIWSVILLAVDLEQIVRSLTWAVILTFILFVILLKLFIKSGLWTRISLMTKQSNVNGYNVKHEGLIELVGKKGTALTPLRPAGSVEIDDKRYDAITEGDYIEAGQLVVVSLARTNHLLVRKVKEEK